MKSDMNTQPDRAGAIVKRLLRDGILREEISEGATVLVSGSYQLQFNVTEGSWGGYYCLPREKLESLVATALADGRVEEKFQEKRHRTILETESDGQAVVYYEQYQRYKVRGIVVTVAIAVTEGNVEVTCRPDVEEYWTAWE